MSEKKQKRRRLNPTHRWSNDETRDMLETVLEEVKHNPESFEKPTAQRFYSKVMEKTPGTSSLNWLSLKNKMRSLKSSYMSAVSWKNQTGAGLMAEGMENNVIDYIHKLCPFWDILDQIFGQRKNVVPAVVIETTQPNFGESVNYERAYVETSIANCDEEIDVAVSYSNFPHEEERFIGDNEPVPLADIEPEPEPAEAIEIINDDSMESPSPLDTQTSGNSSFESLKNQLKTRYRKSKPTSNSGSISVLVNMQEKKLIFEEKKWERQMEMEDRKMDLEREKLHIAKVELEQQIALKRFELERDERLALAKLKFEAEVEERVRKYELDLRARINN